MSHDGAAQMTLEEFKAKKAEKAEQVPDPISK